VRGIVALAYICSCLSVFVIISCFGLVVNCVEFSYQSSSVGSVAQIYYPSSLFGKVLLADTLNYSCKITYYTYLFPN
jgi:hypothetical protein